MIHNILTLFYTIVIIFIINIPINISTIIIVIELMNI